MGEVAFLRKLLFPYIIASQAVPKLALAPLFILWFGFGMTSKVVITALVCFFPLLENTVTAIQSSDKQKQELFKMLGHTISNINSFKNSCWYAGYFAGLRVSVVLAIVGAVVGEFIGGSEGLGALIIASQAMMDTPLMFATLILLTIFGMILYLIVTWFEKKWSNDIKRRYKKMKLKGLFIAILLLFVTACGAKEEASPNEKEESTTNYGSKLESADYRANQSIS